MDGGWAASRGSHLYVARRREVAIKRAEATSAHDFKGHGIDKPVNALIVSMWSAVGTPPPRASLRTQGPQAAPRMGLFAPVQALGTEA